MPEENKGRDEGPRQRKVATITPITSLKTLPERGKEKPAPENDKETHLGTLFLTESFCLVARRVHRCTGYNQQFTHKTSLVKFCVETVPQA